MDYRIDVGQTSDSWGDAAPYSGSSLVLITCAVPDRLGLRLERGCMSESRGFVCVGCVPRSGCAVRGYPVDSHFRAAQTHHCISSRVRNGYAVNILDKI